MNRSDEMQTVINQNNFKWERICKGDQGQWTHVARAFFHAAAQANANQSDTTSVVDALINLWHGKLIQINLGEWR